MMNQYMKELEQVRTFSVFLVNNLQKDLKILWYLLKDPFDPDEFVERMVRRSMQESQLEDDQFDPEMIHDIFTQAIQDLKVRLY